MHAVAQKNHPVSGIMFYSKPKFHHNMKLNSSSIFISVEWYTVRGI